MGINSRALYSYFVDDITDGEPFDPFGKEISLYGQDGVFASPRSFALQHCARSLLKKFQDEGESQANARAIEKFLAVNNTVGKFVAGSGERLWDDYLLGHFRDIFGGWLDRHVYSKWSLADAFANGRTGPGSARFARGEDFYTKMFSSQISATSEGLVECFSRSLKLDPRWLAAEKLRSSTYGGFRLTQSSTLSCVPKNREISRTTCTEPSLNMYYQLGLGAILEAALTSGFGIKLSEQQSRNRSLAMSGSLLGNEGACGYSTIDLSSASDTISLSLIEWACPPWFKGLLHFTRTPLTVLPNGSEVKLNMISTMGNGFTFPLQTAIFACCVLSVYRFRGVPVVYWAPGREGNFGVNGDDIICRNDCYDMVCHLLEILGFSINREKSFSKGYFRESCGGDFYLGHNVRGVYLQSLLTQQDRCSAVNRLNRWSALWQKPLRRTIRYLVRDVKKLYVPRWESDDSGIHVPLSAITQKVDPDTQSLAYRRWMFIPDQLGVGEDAISVPKKLKRKLKSRLYNPEGLGLAFLRGHLRANSITIRTDRGKFVLKEGIAPHWDATQMGTAAEQSSSTWCEWDIRTKENLGLTA